MQAFESGVLEVAIEREIRRAYASPGQVAGAVRSSASAEDLPHLSFAGQHDPFLNVRGVDDLLRAVRQCWASLWSARAIAYRVQKGASTNPTVMAVVVQEMVDATVSGVLFTANPTTANPTTGSRSELVVNASFGLGEAIVGGTVDPDTYVVDRHLLE